MVRNPLSRLLPGALAALVALVPAAAGAATRTVSVADDYYAAKTVTIARGDTVRWVWKGRHRHDVTNTSFGSSPLQRHGTFSVRFTSPGRYRYYCGVHMKMSGTVVVQR